MAFFKAMGFTVLGLAEALRRLKEGLLPPKTIVLTFDDGYADFYHLVAPVLKQNGFGATVFVVTGFLGDRARWLKGDNRAHPPLLTEAQLLELNREGFEIGSHGVTHRRMSQLSESELQEELLKSRQTLEGILHEDRLLFCYPYGDYNKKVRDATEKAGYIGAVTCDRGRTTHKTDPFRLPRVAVSFGDTMVGLLWKMYVKAKPVT